MERILDKLVAWANRWERDFNVNECGVMHIGKKNVIENLKAMSMDKK